MEGRGGNRRVRFGFVPAGEWERVRHLLLPAIAWDGDRTEADGVAALRGGPAQLWIGEDDEVRCGVVTCLSRVARGLVCEIWLMGGRDRRLWLHFIDIIEAAARNRGCISIELIGRKGWVRLLPEYRQSAVVLRKEL